MSRAGKTAPTKPKLLGFGWVRARLAEGLSGAGMLSDGVGGVIGVLIGQSDQRQPLVNESVYSTRFSLISQKESAGCGVECVSEGMWSFGGVPFNE